MEDLKKFWNGRFAQKGYMYGEKPNAFLEAELSNIKPGKILFPAEGEGRNSVFAAEKDWQVEAFDWSSEGYKKAIKLAEKRRVPINYHVGDFLNISFEKNSFDCVAMLYAHFPKTLRPAYFKKLNSLLKPGGTLLFEGFGSHHLEYQRRFPNIGGPEDNSLLFSTDEIKKAFTNMEFSELIEEEIHLNEGEHHSGKGSVVRAVGQKSR